MMNLITNAIRYTPEGGQVWVRIEQEGDLAAIIVADQGKGIAEEDQDRIFDKFERVDPTEPGRHRPRPLHRPPPRPRHGRRHRGRQRAGAGRPLHLHIAFEGRGLSRSYRLRWTSARQQGQSPAHDRL